jgi:hypothetical protein
VADVVAFILELRQLRQFVSGTDEASKAIKGTGDAAEQSGKKAGIGWKGIAKWAAGAGALYGAQRYIRGAVDQTESLARATIGLQRQTGLDTETASAWVNVLKERNIQSKQFQMGLVKLGKSVESQNAGNKKSVELWKQLGVSQDTLRHGSTEQILEATADAFSKMQDPMQRSVYAQQLFGRAGLALLPILAKGKKGVEDAIGVQEKYGNVLTDKSGKSAAQLVERQRELDAAMAGAKLQLGQALLPVLLQVSKALVWVAQAMQPLTRNALALKILILVLTAAFIAYKIALIPTVVWTNLATAATWLWNAAMDANPIMLVVLALAALVAALIIAYKRVGWFRDIINTLWHAIMTGAQWVWNWIKANWPLLVGILGGPFGVAVALIITHFGRLKSFVLGVVQAIKDAFNGLVAFIKNVPGRIGGAIRKIPGVGLASKALGAVGSVVPHLQGGGTIARGGSALVGERGPELLTVPAGGTVTPLSPAAVAGGGLQIAVPVYLDGKEIARSVARVTADQLARR